jgi:hypothetical protein
VGLATTYYFLSECRSPSYFTTDSQSVSMSWYRAPLRDLRPDITSCRSVEVEVTLRLLLYPCGSCDQILLPVGMSKSKLLYGRYFILVGLATRYYFLSECLSYFTTDSQSVCLGIEHPRGTCDQILLPVRMLLSEICGLVSIGRPL